MVGVAPPLSRGSSRPVSPGGSRWSRLRHPGTLFWRPFSARTPACWKPPLHDIGYAPDLAVTDLYQLDGARYLRDAERADTLCAGWLPITPMPSSKPANTDLLRSWA